MGANPFVGGRGARHGARHARPVAEINVTPLVDVMLVLLVIFMVTAPLLTSTVDVDLPRTQAGQSRGQDDPVTVTVNAQNQIFIGDSPIEPDQLVARLRAIGENRRDLRIYVRGDRQIAYGRVMEVMGIITAAGYERVALVVEAAQGGPAPIAAPSVPGAAPPAATVPVQPATPAQPPRQGAATPPARPATPAAPAQPAPAAPQGQRPGQPAR